MKKNSQIFIMLLLCGLLCPALPMASKVPAKQMQQLLVAWPPAGWQITPPGSNSPYPPYIADGEFSGTIYRQNTAKKLWSSQVIITDQHTDQQAKRMLNNFPYCEESEYKGHPARVCATLGEDLGRRRLAYIVGRFLIEISVIGPIPLQLPELQLNLPAQDQH